MDGIYRDLPHILYDGGDFRAFILLEEFGGEPITCVIAGEPRFVGLGQLIGLRGAFPSLNEILVARCRRFRGFLPWDYWRNVTVDHCPKFDGSLSPRGRGSGREGWVEELVVNECKNFDVWRMKGAVHRLRTLKCPTMTGNSAPHDIHRWWVEDGPRFTGLRLPASLITLVVRRCPLFTGEGLCFDLSGLNATVDDCATFVPDMVERARLAKVDSVKIANRMVA